MTQESAIVEEKSIETNEAENTSQTDPAADDYEIEEPDDGQESEDTEEFQVPVIDNLDDEDDEKIPSSDDQKETPPKASKKEADSGKEKKADDKTQGKLPEDLVAKAKKLGISEEDIALFEKPEQLQRLCNLIPPKAAEEQKPQEKPQEQPARIAADEGEFKIELDPAMYEPGICKAMESTAAQINGLKKTLSEVISAVRQQSEASFERTFEGMIAGLGEEFADTLGKGTLDEIGTGSDFFKNRCRLIEEMNAVAAGYAQTGKSVPTPKQLFQRALNSVFGDKIKANVRREVAAQLEKRAGQIISRPTGKKGKDSQTPEQRATTAVREKLKEFGADEQTDIQDDF